MSDEKPLLHSLQGTGTPYGISNYRQLAFGCGKKVSLRTAWENQTGAAAGNLGIGSITHAFLEMYYTPENDPNFQASAVRFESVRGDPEEEARLEAERIFRAYRARFPAGELGNNRYVEHYLPQGKDGTEIVDHDELVNLWAPVVEFVGLPYTARLDMVIRVTPTDCKRIKKTRGLNLKPGHYLIDYKTAAWHSAHMENVYRRDVQFIAYHRAWNYLYPTKRLNGTIVIMLTKTKRPDQISLLIPAPNAADYKILRHTMTLARERLEEGKFSANPDRCHDYFRTCDFLLDGQCKRF